jgi:hypothetical protein
MTTNTQEASVLKLLYASSMIGRNSNSSAMKKALRRRTWRRSVAQRSARRRPNAYSFEFNTESLGNYGIVVPTWVKNASGVEGFNGTLITLKLRRGWDQHALIQKLETLNFAFILFARRLELINLSFQNTGGSMITKEVSKVTDKSYQGNNVVIYTRRAGQKAVSDHYLLRRHAVEGMPPETRRPSTGKREIILAFPHRNDVPLIEDQQTFAYLPIKDFGFKVGLLTSLTVS